MTSSRQASQLASREELEKHGLASVWCMVASASEFTVPLSRNSEVSQ
jgi:hypothetical protein